jgi:hypothetical protein
MNLIDPRDTSYDYSRLGEKIMAARTATNYGKTYSGGDPVAMGESLNAACKAAWKAYRRDRNPYTRNLLINLLEIRSAGRARALAIK